MKHVTVLIPVLAGIFILGLGSLFVFGCSDGSNIDLTKITEVATTITAPTAPATVDDKAGATIKPTVDSSPGSDVALKDFTISTPPGTSIDVASGGTSTVTLTIPDGVGTKSGTLNLSSLTDTKMGLGQTAILPPGNCSLALSPGTTIELGNGSGSQLPLTRAGSSGVKLNSFNINFTVNQANGTQVSWTLPSDFVLNLAKKVNGDYVVKGSDLVLHWNKIGSLPPLSGQVFATVTFHKADGSQSVISKTVTVTPNGYATISGNADMTYTSIDVTIDLQN